MTMIFVKDNRFYNPFYRILETNVGPELIIYGCFANFMFCSGIVPQKENAESVKIFSFTVKS